MLFHGLGGKHQDMEPIATQFLAPAGYASLECDARGHGVSEGLFGLDGARDVQDTRELFTWLTARPEISDTQSRRARDLARRRCGLERDGRGSSVQGNRPDHHGGRIC